MSCGVGCRCGLDPTLLWLWHRPAATAPIRALAWEPPCAPGAAQEMAKKQTNKQTNTLVEGKEHQSNRIPKSEPQLHLSQVG